MVASWLHALCSDIHSSFNDGDYYITACLNINETLYFVPMVYDPYSKELLLPKEQQPLCVCIEDVACFVYDINGIFKCYLE
jgi:hypothetical protein